MSPRTVANLALLTGLVVVASCSTVQGTPSQSICDGLSAEMGGCDTDLPQFTESTCEGTATEFGTHLDARVRAILDGPAAVDGDARSARLKQAVSLVAALANRHLADLDLRADCDVPEFLDAAEARFSPQLREQVGAAMYDGAPVATYDEWVADVAGSLAVIDDEE